MTECATDSQLLWPKTEKEENAVVMDRTLQQPGVSR